MNLITNSELLIPAEIEYTNMPKIPEFVISDICEECGGELIEGKSSYLCSICGLEHDSLYLTNKSTVYSELLIKEMKEETPLGDNFDSSTRSSLKEQKIINIMNEIFVILKAPPKVRDRSVLLFYYYVKKFKGQGLNHVVLSAVALYITSYEFKNEFPVTLKDITSEYETIGHTVGDKSILRIVREYRLKDKSLGTKRSEIYISRICSLICETPDISNRILKTYRLDKNTFVRLLKTYSLEILKKIPYSKRGSKQPFPFAVATVFVCETFFSRIIDKPLILTKKIVAECTKVSEITIRNNSKVIQSCDLSDVIAELSNEIKNNLKP